MRGVSAMSEANESDARDRAFEAIEDFENAIQDANGVSPGSRIAIQSQAFEELTETLGECYAAGMNLPMGLFADAVADVSKLNKTEAKEGIADKSQEKAQPGTDRAPLNEWVDSNLEEVRVVRTTDHVQDTRYVWDFGDITLETESGAEGREHYAWSLFRDAIKDAGGPYLADPEPEQLRDGSAWREWIVGREEEHGTTKVYTGPRTNAVEYLQNRVRTADGFGDLEAAVDYNGVYVEVHNDPPEGAEPVDTDAPEQECPEWRVELLLIPSEWVKDAVEEFGISHRALQNELDARGYTLEGKRSVATREYVAGRYLTFWALNGGFAAPAAYQPDASNADVSGVAALKSDAESDTQDFGTVGGESE